MFAWSRGSTLPKLREYNSQYYPVLLGGGGGGGGCDKSLYLKEDISRGYGHNHCMECFNSPCTEGTICKDTSRSHNQDLMRGALF